MYIGIQLTTPDGYGPLQAGLTYHLLHSDQERNRTRLVVFEGNEKPRAHLITMSRSLFEEGLCDGGIVTSLEQATLPPWLSPLEGLNLSLLDQQRENAKCRHLDRVNERLVIILPLVERAKEVLCCDDPDVEVNRFARACKPIQNESRLRLWFYTYLLFGRNVWALLPPFHRIGKWSRQDRFPGKKFGRPSIRRGRRHGHGVDVPMATKIEESFVRHSAPGTPLKTVYAIAMSKSFGCKVVADKTGNNIYVHPNSEPFPTFEQYLYWLKKRFTPEQIHRSVYGEVRTRSKLLASKGKFSEVVSNLMERVEIDAYYCKDRPSGVIEGTAIPPLCVVRAVCVASGMLVGIGFALAKESGDAYRMALFSMAIGMQRFCKYYGAGDLPGEWPSPGLPPMITFDRGVGATKYLIKDFKHQFPIRELSPSWSGQSKANVESSHPRDIQVDGEPTFFHSRLNAVEMAKREIYRLMCDNETSDASARMTPEMTAAGVQQTPIGIWKYLERRARTDAVPMSFDDAVREFLVPVEVAIRADGVHLYGRRYDSPEMRSLGIFDRVASSQCIKATGYCLELCVRHIWIDIDGKLFELNAMLPIRDDVGQLYVSLPDLEAEWESRRRSGADFREHQLATRSLYRQKFKNDTGKDWDEGTRKSGRAKNTAAAKRELADIKGVAGS